MTESKEHISVLFVCMGNICRSPTAEGVFRHHVRQAGLIDRIVIDSAGTHAYHVGEPPDRRAREAARRRGITMDDIRARQVRDEDFTLFDHILAMDLENLGLLKGRADPAHHPKIRLFLDYSVSRDSEVPDPYYGGSTGFERVLDLVEEASAGLLEALRIEAL